MANRGNLTLVKDQPVQKLKILSVNRVPNSVTDKKITFDVRNLKKDGDHYLCSLPNEPYNYEMFEKYSANFWELQKKYEQLTTETKGDLPFATSAISRISGVSGVIIGGMSITALNNNMNGIAILFGAISLTLFALAHELNSVIADSKPLLKKMKELKKYLEHYENILRENIKIESEYKLMTFVDKSVLKQKVIPLSAFRRK